MRISWIFFLLLLSCEFKNKDEVTFAYSQDFYNISGDIVLNSELNINARVIIFEPNSKIKINENNLILNADEVIFNDAQIITFDEYEYNGCEKNGKNGGSIFINANLVKGSPTLQLKGQNAGKNGYGYRPSVNGNKLYHPDDNGGKTKLPYAIKNNCTPSQPINNNTIKEFWLNTKYDGGDSGNLYVLKHSSLIEFYPNIEYMIGRGDFIFTVESRSGDMGFWAQIPTGQNGQPTDLCILENGFGKCFDDLGNLKNYLNKRENER
jgi:hypothetical protein